MELVVARQDTQVLTLDKVVCTNGTGEVASIRCGIGRGVRLRLRGGRDGLVVRVLLGRRQFTFMWSRVHNIGRILRAGRRLLAGLGFRSHGHLDVPLGGIDAIGIIIIAKFDDWYCIEHCSCYTSCSTLPWSARHSPRSIPFGMTVSADGTCNDNTQKEGRDNPGDTVENDHRLGGISVQPWMTGERVMMGVPTSIGTVAGASGIAAIAGAGPA